MSSFKKILIGAIVIALLVAVYQTARRVVAEQRNTTVEIVADLDDFRDMSYNMDMPLEEVSEKLRSVGANSVAVSETTINKLQQSGHITFYSGADITLLDINNKYKLLAHYMKDYIQNNSIDVANATVIFTEDVKIYEFLKESLENRFGESVHTHDSSAEDLREYYLRSSIPFEFPGQSVSYAILVKRNPDKIESVGVGIRREDLDNAKKLGFTNIVPRIENYDRLSFDDVDNLFNTLKEYKVRTIIFNGTQVLGYDSKDKEEEKLKYIGDTFSKDGSEIITAILEKPAETDLETVQKGITSLAKYSSYKNSKVYSIDPAQLARISPRDMAEQWGRAISQRNVRIIYLRPLTASYKVADENFKGTLESVNEIRNRINYMNMKIGTAKGFGEINQNILVQLIIAIGTIAGGFLILQSLFKEKKWLYILFVLGMVVLIGLYVSPNIYKVFGDLMNKAIAFAAATIFPSLSAIYLLYIYNKYSKSKKLTLLELMKNSTAIFIIAILISVVGGVYVGAILSGSEYILKLDTFRGVKLSFIIPILFFIGAYILKIGIFTDKEERPLGVILQSNKLLNTTITVKYGAAVALILIVMAVLILRSGNNLITSVSSAELIIRNFLEKYLVARPRTKELIAFPILMLIGILSNYKHKQLAFLAMIIGMIGIEGVVNSFCHIRMPILITTISSIYSLIFGIIIGTIMMVIIYKAIDSKSKA